jgi:RelA/SpoT family (p)ppGpp synthetase
MIRLYELELEKECKYGKDVQSDLNALISLSEKHIINVDIDLLTRAFNFCVSEFDGIDRKSGDPYYTHPLKVAMIVMEEMNYGDNETIVAALLHDVIEDKKNITYDIILNEFGKNVADIVEGVTKIKGQYTQGLDKAATYSKLFESLIRDVRVILIKLADRLDNLRTLHWMRPDQQIVISKETLNFYTPFAQRLGLIKIKRKLEDLSLYFADREKYEYIKRGLDEKLLEFISLIEHLENLISTSLNELNVSHAFALEHKHIYEIYKMLEQGRDMSDIDNFFSVVIKLLTNDYSQCYRAYGIIANLLGPVRSFDDYYTKPKINFYKALHSSHYTINQKLVEVIIRTEEMDNLIDRGMISLLSIRAAAKNFNIQSDDLEEWTSWMQELVNEGEEDAVQKIWGTIRMNLDREYIVVFTPDRKDFHLPINSSTLDLAFLISDYTGLHYVSAKVNGELKNPKYELRNNDVVEIITSPNSCPDETWMNYVVTFKAVVKLSQYYKALSSSKINSSVINNHMVVQLRITGEDRVGMLADLTNSIGQVNIQRVSLYKTNDMKFEGIFSINIINDDMINELIVRLFSVRGLLSADIIENDTSD